MRKRSQRLWLIGAAAALTTGAVALAVMVGCNVWARGLLKLMAPLVGLLAGLGLGLVLDFAPARLQAWQMLDWVHLPQVPVFGWRDIPLAEAQDTLHLDIQAGMLADPAGELAPAWQVDESGHVWWKIRTHANHYELIRSCFVRASR